MSLNSVFRHLAAAVMEGNNSPTQRMTLHSVCGVGGGGKKERGNVVHSNLNDNKHFLRVLSLNRSQKAARNKKSLTTRINFQFFPSL